MPLMAEVANTCPLLPTDRTTIDAVTTIKSEIIKLNSILYNIYSFLLIQRHIIGLKRNKLEELAAQTKF